MRITHAVVIVVLALCAGCGKPQDIVFGPEPLKQMVEQGDQFKKLPEEDRVLLVAYLGVSQLGKALGVDTKSPTGRTVGEVLVDARAWRAKQVAAEAAAAVAAKQKAAEEEALKARLLSERKALADRVNSAVTVAILGTRVMPRDVDAGRFDEHLAVSYAIANKSSLGIRQLKGALVFKDATGDKVGMLSVDFDEPVGAGKTLQNARRYWRINRFLNHDVERIAGREFSSMTAAFVPESIAFDGGEVLKAPPDPQQ